MGIKAAATGLLTAGVLTFGIGIGVQPAALQSVPAPLTGTSSLPQASPAGEGPNDSVSLPSGEGPNVILAGEGPNRTATGEGPNVIRPFAGAPEGEGPNVAPSGEDDGTLVNGGEHLGPLAA